MTTATAAALPAYPPVTLADIPTTVQLWILEALTSQDTRRRIVRRWGRSGVDEWRDAGGTVPRAVAQERAALAANGRRWRELARAAGYRPADVRRTVHQAEAARRAARR